MNVYALAFYNRWITLILYEKVCENTTIQKSFDTFPWHKVLPFEFYEGSIKN